MNLLVTGGAGFIGSHFVLRHRAQYPDDRIVVLDKLTYAGDESLLDPVKGMITFHRGDITEVGVLGKLVKEHSIETIVNFAAETHVDRSIENAVPFIHSNILGVASLIEACKLHRGLRLLHISTDEVYGDIGDDDPPRVTHDVLCPSSPYAATKAAGEMLLLGGMRTYRIPVCITRCTNNYGPHQTSEKFIPTIIRYAFKDQKIPVYAQGKNKRDWLYVSDHCDALEIILKTPWAFADDKIGGSGHLFNISANDERENIAVAKTVLKVLGKSEDLITFVQDRPGHDWRYALDSSAIRRIGWEPKVPFEEGIQKTVEWYRMKLKG